MTINPRVGDAGSPSTGSPLSVPQGDQGITENLKTKTSIKGKVEDARFQKVTDLSSFVETSGKLKTLRANREGKSGVHKFFFRRSENQIIKDLQHQACHHIKHYKFGHNESDSDAVKAWITCALDASSKDQKAILSTIGGKLSAPGHQFNPSILKGLNELAGRDPRIKAMKDSYVQMSFTNPPSIGITHDDLDAISKKILQSNYKDSNETVQMEQTELSKLQTQRTNRYMETAKVWLETANAASPKKQQAMYAQIQTILNKGSYVPELLTLLNEQAKDNPQVAVLRDAYVEAKKDQIFGGFKSQLTQQLKQATFSEFINSFTSTNLLDIKTNTQLLAERATLASLLNDPTYANHKTTLQLLLHVYDVYLENDPHKRTKHLEAFSKEVLQPAMDQVSKLSSLTTDAVKQQAEMIRNYFKACNHIFDAYLAGKTSSMQKQGKTDTLENLLSTQTCNWLATNVGQTFSQLLPTLDELVKHGSLKGQAEFLQKAQERLDKFATHTARLEYIKSSSNNADQRSQILSLTAGFPCADFPYEFAQHLRTSVADGSIKDPNIRSAMFPAFTQGDNITTKAKAYLEAAQEQLKNDQLSPEIRSSLEQVKFLNELYLMRNDSNATHALGNELKQKPFDIEVVNMLGRACNTQFATNPLSNIFNLGNQYIQDHRDAFSDHFRNQLNQLIDNPQQAVRDRFMNACRLTEFERPGLKLANQPIAQLEASQEVINAMLASDEFKDNAFLQELTLFYQQAIEAKRAKT
ncbi:MAG: hypothetical protein LBH52_01550 [Puniceicoccales bacterium]|jgi:hypothetical protein|nr:hypothetical protein [Puniceicoccales bacterium]